MLTSKILTEIIENHSEFSGCPNSSNNFFQIDLDKLRNYLWYCYEKQLCWRWVCSGCKHIPKSFDLLKIWAKMPPKAAWLQKIATKVWRKTH